MDTQFRHFAVVMRFRHRPCAPARPDNPAYRSSAIQPARLKDHFKPDIV